MDKQISPLPYLDDKPIGAADFYFAINATFRFILNRFGLDVLRSYWTDLGSSYFAPVSDLWRSKGLVGIEQYWSSFFKAEPGAEVNVQRTDKIVVLDIKVCPAIRHLRVHHREIVPCFCQHCFFVNEAIAARAGFSARVRGGNGSCTQTFQAYEVESTSQDLAEIKDAAPC